MAASARIIGINQRDLRTFEVDTTLALRLRDRVPGSCVYVAESGIRTGGAERNQQYLDALVDWGSASEVSRVLLIDPQTSGGLLVACEAEKAPAIVRRIEMAGYTSARSLGRVEDGDHGVRVVA